MGPNSPYDSDCCAEKIQINGPYCADDYNLYYTGERCRDGPYNRYFYSCVPPDKQEKLMFLEGVIQDHTCWMGDYEAGCYQE